MEWIKNKTTEELEALLERAKIPFGRVLSLPELEADPQAKAREIFVKVEHPLGFSYKMVSSPIKMSETPPTIERALPTLGQDADDILSKHLGYGTEEIAELKQEGVIK